MSFVVQHRIAVSALVVMATCGDESIGAPERDTAEPAGTSERMGILVGAGDIGRCSRPAAHQTARLLDTIPGTVFTTGDHAYPDGAPEDFEECYAPSWGRHRSRTRPSPGNHDYHTPGAAGYFEYFGANAGARDLGYYSFDIGDWHVISLNSEIDMDTGSPQEQWLRADLAANDKPCTVAYWHEPAFSSGARHESSRGPLPLWDALHEFHAEIVINGHEHLYERFEPMGPDGEADPEHGIRQFTVGTGGADLYGFAEALPNSAARNDHTHGILKLTLYATSYQWEFVPVEGGTYADHGSGACHQPTGLPNSAPIASAGGPYTSEATVAFDGSDSEDPEANLPLGYTWSFGDGATASGVAPSHTYESEGTYEVELLVTDALGAVGGPARTTAWIGNLSPSVDLGTDVSTTPGDLLEVTISFEDPGADDAPWSYALDFGDGSRTEGTVERVGLIVAEHTYAQVGQYQMIVHVTDKDAGTGSDSVQVSVVEDGHVLVAAGNIGRCSRDNDESTAELLDAIPGTVVTLGDHAREEGTEEEFRECYDPSWGRHKARTHPVPGDHDYETPAGSGYFGYFGDVAGDPDKGYYSHDLGDWHVIALNSRIDTDFDSPQERWLRADLAASGARCTLAYFHDSRFYSSGSAEPSESVRALWETLYAAGVEIVLGAERRYYERFAPQSPDGIEDPSWGIRQFVVGTGGWGTSSFDTPAPNSEVRESGTYGVLKLTLHPDRYDWEFVPESGETFIDIGSGICHGPPPDA